MKPTVTQYRCTRNSSVDEIGERYRLNHALEIFFVDALYKSTFTYLLTYTPSLNNFTTPYAQFAHLIGESRLFQRSGGASRLF